MDWKKIEPAPIERDWPNVPVVGTVKRAGEIHENDEGCSCWVELSTEDGLHLYPCPPQLLHMPLWLGHMYRVQCFKNEHLGQSWENWTFDVYELVGDTA